MKKKLKSKTPKRMAKVTSPAPTPKPSFALTGQALPRLTPPTIPLPLPLAL